MNAALVGASCPIGLVCRSVDGLVLAVWCPNSASTDRVGSSQPVMSSHRAPVLLQIKFCVMSAFLDGSSRCTQAGDDLGMGQLLEALRRTKSTAAAASHPSFTLGRGLGRLRLPAQGAPIDGDTQSRQEVTTESTLFELPPPPLK